MQKLILEIGINHIKKSFLDDSLSIEKIESLAKNIGLPLEIIKYDGMKSFLSGGRNSNNSASDLIKKIEESNNQNKGFIVPFNTGLNYDKLPLDNIQEELKVLKALSKHEKNAVVIGHEDLLFLIKEKFPELKTICSTIQMLDYKKFKSYEDKFKKYDFVVPLNQHTTYEFLKKYEKYASQIIAFFNHRCSNDNLAKCYAEYSNIERTQAGLKKITYDLKYLNQMIKASNIIPSQLNEEPELQTCYACKRLVCDIESLEGLMKMGVFQFKIARNSKFDEHELQLLKETYDLIKN